MSNDAAPHQGDPNRGGWPEPVGQAHEHGHTREPARQWPAGVPHQSPWGAPPPEQWPLGQYPPTPPSAGPHQVSGAPQGVYGAQPGPPAQGTVSGPPAPGVYGTPTGPAVHGTPSGPPAQGTPSGPPAQGVYGVPSGPPAHGTPPAQGVYGVPSGPPAQGTWQPAQPAQQAQSAGPAWPPAGPSVPVVAPAGPQPAPASAEQGWSQGPGPNLADPNAGWQPRITPSPPRRSVVPVLIAVVIAVLVAGPAGYFAAIRFSGDDDPKAQPSPVASSELPPYEANQLAANRAKFNGDLAAFAENWLPYVGGCISDTDPGNNRLQQGEKSRVSCRAGGLGISFVLYTSIADRDAIRGNREKQNRDGGALAPGVAAPSIKAGASGKSGNYVEYAFRDGAGKTIAGIWWDRQDLPATAYVEAAWAGDLRESWEPLREIWQRRS